MGELIKVDFKQHKSGYPSEFFMPWIPALYKRSENSTAWTYHVKFRVYETGKNFGVQFACGVGGEGQDRPSGFYSCNPVYKKNLEKLWQHIFSMLESYHADGQAVIAKVIQES